MFSGRRLSGLGLYCAPLDCLREPIWRARPRAQSPPFSWPDLVITGKPPYGDSRLGIRPTHSANSSASVWVIQGVKDSRRWYRKLLVRWRKRTITAPVQLPIAKICYLLFAIVHL